ncbi:MAG: MaoC family dehydratase N-terminal domain-containing protein [Burkholderiaceae bacterium]
MTETQPQELSGWIGRTESVADTVSAWRAVALAAALDLDVAPGVGDALAPVWHWLYFLPTHKASELGYDGHARLGGFLPPVPLPRRMWAGGRLKFERLLRIGEHATRNSRIEDLTFKNGRSGSLAFVLVRHTIVGDQGARIIEEHDIVYRAAPVEGAPAPRPQFTPVRAQWSREINPNAVLLFRYSALTFNGHRIHYDRDFCQQEAYPGLVVHGPLIATLLLDLLRRNTPDAPVATFTFKAVSPLFDIDRFSVHGRIDGAQATLWALNHRGELAMQANAELGRAA